MNSLLHPHACPTETKQKHSNKQGCSLPSTLPEGGSPPSPQADSCSRGGLVKNIHTVEGGGGDWDRGSHKH